MKLIPLSKTGKHAGEYFAQVDDVDYDFLMQWSWQLSIRCGIKYARRSKWIGVGKRKSQDMHREIMCVDDGKIFVDHIDHDGLNNQRSNLRLGNKRLNSLNRRASKNGTSKYLGVTLNVDKKRYILKDGAEKVSIRGRWLASIHTIDRHITLGRFKNEEDAARCYDEAAKKYHGEWANLNFKS